MSHARRLTLATLATVAAAAAMIAAAVGWNGHDHGLAATPPSAPGAVATALHADVDDGTGAGRGRRRVGRVRLTAPAALLGARDGVHRFARLVQKA